MYQALYSILVIWWQTWKAWPLPSQGFPFSWKINGNIIKIIVYYNFSLNVWDWRGSTFCPLRPFPFMFPSIIHVLWIMKCQDLLYDFMPLYTLSPHCFLVNVGPSFKTQFRCHLWTELIVSSFAFIYLLLFFSNN